MLNTEEKYIKALAKTHASFDKERKRSHKIIDNLFKANNDKAEAIEKFNSFVKMLLAEGRITKKEVSQYVTRKGTKPANGTVH